MPPHWPNSELSAGALLPLLKKHLWMSCWEAVGVVRHHFRNEAYQDIQDHLNKFSRQVTHRAIWSVYMIGRKKTKSDPVVMFWCVNPDCRPHCGKQAMQVVEEGEVMRRHPGFQVGHCKWCPDFKKPPRNLAGIEAQDSSMEQASSTPNLFFGLEGLEYPTFEIRTTERADASWRRFLCIKPGKRGDLLMTYFTYTNSNSDIHGYSWIGEDSTDKKPISIGEKDFQVPADLCNALESLRLADQDVYIWLDVLCINPDDEEEVKHSYVSIRRRTSDDLSRQSSFLGLQGWVHNFKSRQQVSSKISSWPPRVLTLGGLVQVGRKAFCLAAAHAFEESDDVSSKSSSVGENDFAWNIGEDDSPDRFENDAVEETSRGSATPEQPNLAHTETIISPNYPPITPAGHLEDPPGETDVTMLSIHSEVATIAAPKSTSFKSELRDVVGPLIMSSLSSNAASNLDYALISIASPTRFSYFLSGGKVGEHGSETPKRVATAIPEHNRNVVAYSGSLGPITGTISATPAMTYNPSNNNKPFQELWTVRLHSGLSLGDSGTWVIDADSKDLLGHIVSGTPGTNVAHIIPMVDIFNDLEATFLENVQILDYLTFIELYADTDKREEPQHRDNLVHSSPVDIRQDDIRLKEVRNLDSVPLQGIKKLQIPASLEGPYASRKSRDDRLKPAENSFQGDDSLSQNRHPIRTRVRRTTLGIENTTHSQEPAQQVHARGRYKHTPLARGEDIRIFRLFPGQEGDKIEGVLFPAAMTNFEYDAVSYTWGSPDVKYEILISSITWGSRREKLNRINPASFYIRSNLFAALQAMRNPWRDVYLWVDAICLDWSSKDELRMELSVPPAIYSNAEAVLLWLGDKDSAISSEDAFRFVTDKVCDMFNVGRLFVERDHEDLDLVNHGWLDLAIVMCDSVFSRRWVIREIAFARKVILYSGRTSLAWDDFADAVALFTANYMILKQRTSWKYNEKSNREALRDISRLPVSLLVNNLPRLFQKDDNGKIVGYNLSLEELMLAFSPLQTSDGRDNIYALLSIARDTDQRIAGNYAYGSYTSAPPYHSVVPTYNQTLAEACWQVVQSSVKRTRSVDIICRHWAPSRVTILDPNVRQQVEVVELPSWMPTVAGGSFSQPWTISTQRRTGNSLVGPPGRPIYQASAGILVSDVVKPASFQKKRLDIIIDRTRGHAERSVLRDDPGTSSFYERFQTSDVRDLPILTSDSSTKNYIPPSEGEWFKRWQRAFDSTVENLRLRRASKNENSISNIVKVVLGRMRRKSLAPALELRGIFVTLVERVTSRLVNGTISEEALRIGGWIPRTHGIADHDEVIPDYLWQTLVAGRDHTGERAPNWYRRAFEHILELSDTGFMRDINTNELAETVQSSPIVDLLHRMRDIVWNRSLFTVNNKNWMLGLGPHNMQAGDAVCVLYGCSVPVILRERNILGRQRFELIGECYVHGLMDGEVIEWAKSAKREDSWFNLE